MPVRKLFCSEHYADFVIDISVGQSMGSGIVGIMMRDISDPYSEKTQRAYMELRPEDVPALCRELRRVAKLTKQGGSNG